MKIVFIAPVPPPLTGNSLAAKIFLDKLKEENDLELINLNKNTFKNGASSFERVKQIFKILLKINESKKNAEAIYFSISESTAGNIKDLLIYLICFKKINKLFIHMLGGAGMKSILEKKGIQYRLNKFFIRRVAGVIVEGWPQANTFLQTTAQNKIHIVPNFAEDFLFATEVQVQQKFLSLEPFKILFLSNLLYGKGHNELVEGYLELCEELKNKIEITFIGGFESDSDKKLFLDKINGHSGLIYHSAFVSGEEKKSFYLNAHVFSLPTYYPYEGQPISILEAYAGGCVALVTNHSGIPQIFHEGINGYVVEKHSSLSIKKAIEKIYIERHELVKIALYNREDAFNNYRTSIYCKKMIDVIHKKHHLS